MTEQYFLSLLDGFKRQKLSPEELMLFLDAASESRFESLLGDQLVKDIADYRNAFAVDPAQQEVIWEALNDKKNLLAAPPAHRVHFLKTAWFKYAAAIIILFGVCAYLWTNNNQELTIHKPSNEDILPGRQGAVLTLADGTQVVLDSLENGVVAEQNGTKAIIRNGSLAYQADNVDAVTFNTMATLKGGQYQLTLEDGTKVWLNAASSITYPTAFRGSTREVTVRGEAYFEVKKELSRPFVVKTPKEKITVLGTQFNVNAYADEPAMKVSLLEGSVKIAEKILKPGQAYQQGKVVSTNVAQDVAWKNGLFDFKGQDFAMVMRQIERWYDISVKYDGKVPEKEIRGRMGRDLKFSQVLKVLEKLEVNFRLEGRTLTVSP